MEHTVKTARSDSRNVEILHRNTPFALKKALIGVDSLIIL